MKNAWAILCFIVGAVCVFLLLSSTYRPELMRSFAAGTVLFFLALAWLPYAPIGLDARIAIGFAMINGALCWYFGSPEAGVSGAVLAAVVFGLFRAFQSGWRAHVTRNKNEYISK